MEIRKFVKLKNGLYKLRFDNQELIVHEDIILKYNLLLHKEMDYETINKIKEENIPYMAYSTAIKYLTNNYRSIKDVTEYLIKKEISTSIIEQVIKRLKSEGYLNDEIYAKAFVHDKMALSSDGPYKIKQDLYKKGIDKNIVDKVLLEFTDKEQEMRIKKIVQKQTNIVKNKSAYMLKSKVSNYLSNLGYDQSLIIKYVEDIKVDDTKLQQKEYDKLYKVLSRKYSGKELEYKIKQKMYQKGFNIF